MATPRYQRPKDTHDLYPGAASWEDDSARARFLEDQFSQMCVAFGYGEIRTPTFESTDLFTRSVGEGTDIVSKEMYVFEDKSGRSLALKPESTAPVLRAYLQNGLASQGGVTKLYYIAQHFRYERGQKGRYRQHEQLGVEALGTTDPALDAEVIQLALSFFHRVGIQNLTLKLNSVGSQASRATYVMALKAYIEPFLAEFSDEGKARFEKNPLRLLDTKNERELEILRGAPLLTDYISCAESDHFGVLRGYLDGARVAYTVDPHLVRGFDYYTHTAFEIQSGDLGAQNALGGGGRYDGLVEALGGPPTPGIGFGIGLERVLIALNRLGAEMPEGPSPMAFVVTQGEAARRIGVDLLAQLRAAGIAADMEYGAHSVKAQMRAANAARSRYALIIGDEEVEGKVVQFKNLADGWQLAVPLSETVAWFNSDTQPQP